MTSRVDPSTEGVPVREVADLILSFGLDLPEVPGPRRAARPGAGRSQKAARREAAPRHADPRDAARRRTARDDGPDAPGHRARHHLVEDQPLPVGRPSRGRHGLREDPVRGAVAVGRTVAVVPEVLAKARRMAFDPSHPSALTTRVRPARLAVPAPRTAGDESWAPAGARDAGPDPARRAGGAARWAEWGAPNAAGSDLARRDAGPDADRTDAETGAPPSELIAEVSPSATTGAHAPDVDETAVHDLGGHPARGDGTTSPDAPSPLALRRRSRPGRPLLLATASMASVAVVGATAAAAMALTGGPVTPAANTTAADLDASLSAATPTTAPAAPTEKTPAPAPGGTTGGERAGRDGADTRKAADPAAITAVSHGYRDAARTVAGALPAAMKQSGADRAVARAHGLPAGAPAVTGTGAAAGVVQAALAQIGKPYRWGATGPSGFDCSGLVVYAFGRVGISLPHSSATLSTMGTPVAKADLRPGDLVFYYTPVSHVAIYIGDGKVVNATTEGRPVQISDVDDFPMHNARRI